MFLDFQETEQNRIFDNAAFGYWKVTVERPLRLAVDWREERRERFFNGCITVGRPRWQTPCKTFWTHWGRDPIGISTVSWRK